MMESTRLSKTFAEQGLRIRIRTEAGTKKRGRKQTASSKSTKKAKVSESYMLPNNIRDIGQTAENSKPNVMLRSNELDLRSSITQTSAPTETYILQAPQRLYTSQTRGTAMDSNSTNTSNIVQQANNAPKHSWSSSLPGINIQLPQNGFATSNIRSDFPRIDF
ncbi:hypothetical protein EV179_005738 [Coemansia sp. RSA 487]|nr:hypothetical protein EV179_005738 [Coemansia sp. RSA 487]